MAERRPYTEPFGQFCDALNRFGVDYVVIGSEAVAFHGLPRFSLDFDLSAAGPRISLTSTCSRRMIQNARPEAANAGALWRRNPPQVICPNE